MNYRTLGRTGLSVSEIGLGGIPIQRVSLPEAVSVIQKTHSLGVNFVDTGMEAYRKSPVPPASCTLCGHCERVCPFHLPIIRALRDLRVREEAEKRWGEEKAVAGAPLREYQKEYQEFVELAQKNLGPSHQVPLAYFDYPKPANEGQKATVRGLWQNLKKMQVMGKEEEMALLKELAGKMGIAEKGIKTFENLLTLADYNNIVDLMRILPQKTKLYENFEHDYFCDGGAHPILRTSLASDKEIGHDQRLIARESEAEKSLVGDPQATDRFMIQL